MPQPHWQGSPPHGRHSDSGSQISTCDARSGEVTRLGEAFTFADLEVERVSFEGLTVSVASARTLYRMTRDTVRLEDRADAALLRERFRLDEES